MNAVRMIHSISQYYNSSERMTSLFLKITNQMINTCKKYVRDGYTKLWDVRSLLYKKKLFSMINLNFENVGSKSRTLRAN